MQNSERKTISLKEIKEMVKEGLKNHTYNSGSIIIPGPRFERAIHNALVEHFNNKKYDCQETNAERKDSQVILLCT